MALPYINEMFIIKEGRSNLVLIYRNEYGKLKSNIMTNSNRKNGQRTLFKLGNMELKETDNYKYLGLIQNNKNNMKHHLTIMKGKVEAVYQRILALAGNTTFRNIEMESILINVQSQIEPIITYSGEVWDLNKGQVKELNGIMDKIIKRILKYCQEHGGKHSILKLAC